jgi:hypothetical protein
VTARCRLLAALAAALFPFAASAGIVFTPHLSEYSRLPPGEYTEGTFIFTDIQNVYNRDGKKVHVGAPFIPDGDDVFASLFLFKMLWVGNVFRDSGVPVLRTHPQFCRGIGVLGWQQGSSAVVDRDLNAGQASGASGLGDFFALCGIYGDDHLWGPLKWNGLLATTVKFPIGRYDTQSLLNTGTHYWSYVPQLAAHAELYGRLIFDGTAAYQFNGNNDSPAFGGLTPTRPADVVNYEGNFAWKFNEHWFYDVGYSWRKTVGPNYYDKYSLNLKDQPVQAQDACNNTNNGLGLEVIDPSVCNSTSAFFIQPRPGPYADRGIQGTLLTTGFYYIYRTSSVLNLRAAIPVRGRGGQIDTTYEIYNAVPDGNGGYTRGSNTGLTTTSRQNTVQEAASVSASPYLEIRLVYLFWAP